MTQGPERPNSPQGSTHFEETVPIAAVACSDYDPDHLCDSILAGMKPFGGLGTFVKPGQKILLKPNLFAAVHPKHALTTHPDFVRAICLMIEECGAHAYVGDNPVFGFKSLTYGRTGMKRAVMGTNARLVNLNRTIRRPCHPGKRARSFLLPRNLEAFDAILSLPKLKTHNLMGMTGAVKNSYGLVHGKGERKKLHFLHPDPADFAQMLLDLNNLVRPDLFIVDAVVGSDGNGPRFGDPKQVGYVVVGTQALGVDFVLAEIAGIPFERVGTLRIAMEQEGWRDPLARLEILGAPPERTGGDSFALPREPGGTVAMLPRPIREALIRYSKRSGG